MKQNHANYSEHTYWELMKPNRKLSLEKLARVKQKYTQKTTTNNEQLVPQSGNWTSWSFLGQEDAFALHSPFIWTRPFSSSSRSPEIWQTFNVRPSAEFFICRLDLTLLPSHVWFISWLFNAGESLLGDSCILSICSIFLNAVRLQKKKYKL